MDGTIGIGAARLSDGKSKSANILLGLLLPPLRALFLTRMKFGFYILFYPNGESATRETTPHNPVDHDPSIYLSAVDILSSSSAALVRGCVRISGIQIQPGKHVLDHADYTGPTGNMS